MNEPAKPEPDPAPVAPPDAEPYEPPRIIKVGSLRDVVGKSGPNVDFASHNRDRP